MDFWNISFVIIGVCLIFPLLKPTIDVEARNAGKIFLWLCSGYFFCRLIFTAFYPPANYITIDGQWSLQGLSMTSAKALAFGLILILLMRSGRIADTLLRWVSPFLIVQNLFVILNPRHYGVLFNSGLDGCLIAVLSAHLFYAWDTEAFPFGLFFLSVLSVVITKSSSAAACLIVAIGSFATARNRFFLPVIALSAISGALFSWVYIGADLLNDNGRMAIWKAAAGFQIGHGKLIFGFGPGIWEGLFPVIQKFTGVGSNAWGNHIYESLFLTAHNDFLQVFFEYGAIGFSLFTACVIYYLWKTFKNPWIFSLFSTFVTMMIFQSPCHLALTLIIATVILKIGIEFDENQQS